MMKNLPSLLFAMVLGVSAYAQITITAADLPVSGDIITTYTDTMAGVENTPGASGAGQIWDFSGVVNHYSTTTAYMAAASTPYAASFPSSNLAMTTDSNFYVFMTAGSSLVTIDGVVGQIINPGDIIYFNPTQTMYQLPLNYGDAYSDNYRIDFQGDGSAFGVYSFRYLSNGTIIDSVDAHGILITPLGTYNTIRVKRFDNTTDSIFIKLFSDFEPWTLFQSSSNSNLTYSWLANGGKMPIVQMSTDSLGNTTTITYSEILGTFGIQETEALKITIGPNPFKENITVNIPEELASDLMQIIITDINGKTVLNKTTPYSSQLNLDLANLQSGMYFINVQSSLYSSSAKIIKM